jgi:hypothetical protein
MYFVLWSHLLCNVTFVENWWHQFYCGEDLTVLGCYAVLTGTQLAMFKEAQYLNLQGLISPRRWRHCSPLRYPCPCTSEHSTTLQKTWIFLSTSLRIWNFMPILCLLLLTCSVLYIALLLILLLSGLWQFYTLVGGNTIIIPVDAASSIMVYVIFSKMLIEMYHLHNVIIPHESSTQIIHIPIPVHQQSYYLPKFLYAHRNAIWMCTCFGKRWGEFTLWRPWGHTCILNL